METKKSKRNFKVWDHYHITEEFRGAAHKTCNINYRLKPFIPVIFYSLKGYGAYFILQAANKVPGIKNISVIPLNKEKYVSFSIDGLRFIDMPSIHEFYSS
jgi:hypothetical protein